MTQRPSHAIQDRSRKLVDPVAAESPAFLHDEPKMALSIPKQVARTCQRLLGNGYAFGPTSNWSEDDFRDREDDHELLPITGAAIGTAVGCVPQGFPVSWGILANVDWHRAFQKVYYQRGLMIKIPANAVRNTSPDYEIETQAVSASPTLMNCGYLVAGAGYPFELDRAKPGMVPGTVRVIFTLQSGGDLAADEPILLRTVILAHNLATMLAAVTSAHLVSKSVGGPDLPMIPDFYRNLFVKDGCNAFKFQATSGIQGFVTVPKLKKPHRLPPEPLQVKHETSLSFLRRKESIHNKQNRHFMLTAALMKYILDLELQ